METLYTYALLVSAGFNKQNDFSKCLDELFINNPEDELYFELEEMTLKNAVLHTIANAEDKINTKQFLKILFYKLSQLFDENNVEYFSARIYSIWTNLAESIRYTEPFYKLSYVDEMLEFADRQSCIEEIRNILNYYE